MGTAGRLPPAGGAVTAWTRRSALVAGAALASASGAAAFVRGRSGRTPRNLLWILADDHRADALSVEGHPVVRTPHIDALARDGVRFARAFTTTSICNPSRAAMLTGLYAHACGVPRNQDALAPGTQTALTILRRAGIHTALFGKWGVTGHGPVGEARTGEHFDRWLSLPISSRPRNAEASDQGRPARLDGYTDEVITERAAEHLDRLCAGAQPWCLVVSFRAPHPPLVAPPSRASDYASAVLPPPVAAPPGPGAPAFVRRIAERQRPGGGRSGETDEAAAETRRKDYLRCVAAVDDFVGRILDRLDRHAAADETAVLYGSDNGSMGGDHGLWDKRVAYEPSIRIPLIVRAPASGAQRGTVSEGLVLNTDVAPTLLDLVGVARPRGFARHGRSLLPLLRGETPAWREDFYYRCPAERDTIHPTIEAVRTARWKYIEAEGEAPELYDLDADPGEEHSRSGDPTCADVRGHLAARLRALRAEVGAGKSIEAVEAPPGP